MRPEMLMFASGCSTKTTLMILGSEPIDWWVPLTMSRISCALRGWDRPDAIWHSIKGMCRLLLQAGDEIFVVGITCDKFGKMFAVLDKIDPAALADHEEDIVRRLARRLADDAKQASRKRAFLLVCPAVAHIA